MQRLCVLLPALWAGVLLCIAFLATPTVFAVLPTADAGRVVGRVFAQEAAMSLVLALAMVLLERRRAPGLSTESLLALGAMFCTVAGYYAVQPLMAEARVGHGPLGFGTLHAVSLAFFATKGLLVLALAWRVSSAARASSG